MKNSSVFDHRRCVALFRKNASTMQPMSVAWEPQQPQLKIKADKPITGCIDDDDVDNLPQHTLWQHILDEFAQSFWDGVAVGWCAAMPHTAHPAGTSPGRCSSRGHPLGSCEEHANTMLDAPSPTATDTDTYTDTDGAPSTPSPSTAPPPTTPQQSHQPPPATPSPHVEQLEQAHNQLLDLAAAIRSATDEAERAALEAHTQAEMERVRALLRALHGTNNTGC